MAKLIVGQNDLATVNPDLTAEWHPTKNNCLLPTQVTAGSNRKVWWKGTCGHEWEAVIGNRSRGIGCPHCSKRHVVEGVNDLVTVNPSLAGRQGKAGPMAMAKRKGSAKWKKRRSVPIISGCILSSGLFQKIFSRKTKSLGWKPERSTPS